jgi:hypothetical protein
VLVLTLLRVFRRHSDSHAHAGMDSPPMPNVVLRVWSDEEHESLVESGPESRRLARTGERVVVLLRRLRFNYGGGIQQGCVELSGNVIMKWLMPKPTVPDVVGWCRLTLSNPR